MLNYDPDDKPQASEELLRFAEDNRLHVVHVICDEEGAKVGDHTGVSFAAAVPFMPRTGERITLEDGTTCEVRRAYYKTATVRDEAVGADIIMLVPTVYAVRLGRSGEQVT